MKNLIKKVSLLTLTVVLVSSCSKYEEGPEINLTPKKDRVANTWVIEKATDQDEDVTADFENYELYLTSDGDAELDAKYDAFGQTFENETNGTWTFLNDDKDIEFDYEDDSQDAMYQILKLTKKEMWLREVGKDLELHLKSK